MHVSVFGLGYVGVVTAACLAKAGHDVVGVDVNAEKVAMVNEARAPVVEPGLDDLLAEVVPSGSPARDRLERRGRERYHHLPDLCRDSQPE